MKFFIFILLLWVAGLTFALYIERKECTKYREYWGRHRYNEMFAKKKLKCGDGWRLEFCDHPGIYALLYLYKGGGHLYIKVTEKEYDYIRNLWEK